jgi:hypothetical protein
MANQNLKLVNVDNVYQTFGQTDYVVFNAETTDKHPIAVAITHNALRRTGIDIMLVDSLVGSTVIIKDSTDNRTGLVLSADEKVNRVVNAEINPNTGKPFSIVLCNALDCSILKSDIYLADTKDLASSISAKVVMEKEKERKLLAMKRASDRLRGIIAPTVEQKTEQSVDAELPTNEESPF